MYAQPYDYETAETTVPFTYFGSTLDGTNTEVIANPNATGDNTSSMVVSYTQAANSEVWAGAYSNALPTPLDLTSGGKVCLDVHFDHVGDVALKLENSSNGFGNWITVQPNTKVGEWENICFDLSEISIEDPFGTAAGGVFGTMVLFFDFNSNSTDDVVTYFDNITYVPGAGDVVCTTIYDFEDDGLSTNYIYFGSTLDSDTAAVIGNPNPVGNESLKVLEYVKAMGSEVWAGAYASPQPTVDATNGLELCVDVHMDHLGNIALKLEQSGTIGNWIRTVENTVMNEWETLCIDLSLPGLEDDMTPAAGHVFGQLVIFPDFGMSDADNDVTTYIDNLVIKSSTEVTAYDVTFSVDMNSYTESFTQPYVSGTFNDWSADANPLSDDDLDGVWETTITMNSGSFEYKYQLDGWATQEEFSPSDECVVGDQYINRAGLAIETGALPTVCYNSCYACDDEVTITWNVNMNNEDVSADGVYVAGGPFGHAELPAMTDDDGDGIYTTSIRRQKGYAADYTFLNGICLPNWECKENIAGQDCAVEPFNDRTFVADEDLTINTCFGDCSETTECLASVEYNATFRVDMNDQTVAAEGVFLAGGLINSWTPANTPMSDDDGDGIWEVTVPLPATLIEYKYVNGPDGWEELGEGDCTITSGDFINRALTMEAKDTIVTAYLFGTCDVVVANKETVLEDVFTLNPSVTSDMTILSTRNTDAKIIEIYNLNGQLVQQLSMDAGQQKMMINVADLSAGMYIVNMRTNEFISTKRLVIQ